MDRKEIFRPVIVFIPGAASSGPYAHFASQKAFKKQLPYFGEPLTKMPYRHFVCPLTESLDRATIDSRTDECVRMILDVHQESFHGQFGERGIGKVKNTRRFILIGHSMGGLIARAVAADARTSKLVHSVLTLSTPHRGTLIANFAVDPGAYYAKYEYFWIHFFQKIDMDSQNKSYLYNLLMDRSGLPETLFEYQDRPANPSVRYLSVRGSKPDMKYDALSVPHRVLTDLLITSYDHLKENLEFEEGYRRFGPSNDGIVPELSMTFGHDLGHVVANHIDTACTLGATKGCLETASLVHRYLADPEQDLE